MTDPPRYQFPRSGNHSLLVQVILFGDADGRVPKKAAGRIDSILLEEVSPDDDFA